MDERLNREAPLIDHFPVCHYGRLAHRRSKPTVAARKYAFYFLPGRIFRQTRPAKGFLVRAKLRSSALPPAQPHSNQDQNPRRGAWGIARLPAALWLVPMGRRLVR